MRDLFVNVARQPHVGCTAWLRESAQHRAPDVRSLVIEQIFND
jgi:hypothetical protein